MRSFLWRQRNQRASIAEQNSKRHLLPLACRKTKARGGDWSVRNVIGRVDGSGKKWQHFQLLFHRKTTAHFYIWVVLSCRTLGSCCSPCSLSRVSEWVSGEWVSEWMNEWYIICCPRPLSFRPLLRFRIPNPTATTTPEALHAHSSVWIQYGRCPLTEFDIDTKTRMPAVCVKRIQFFDLLDSERQHLVERNDQDQTRPEGNSRVSRPSICEAERTQRRGR